jgi:hypothetical protein
VVLGWRVVIARQREVARNVELMREGKDAALKTRARGNYFRRNRSEISSETERNTSTARTPIMQKAIIIFSGCAKPHDGMGKPHASRAREVSLAFAVRELVARGKTCGFMVKSVGLS